MMKQISAAEFENEVLKADVPVVVDFFASWCGPCKMIAPVLDQLATELAGKAKIVKVDVDESRDVAMEYNIKSMPTFIFFNNGEIADKAVGALPKNELMDKIAPLIK